MYIWRTPSNQMQKKSDLLSWLVSNLQTHLKFSLWAANEQFRETIFLANSGDGFGLDCCLLMACVFQVPFQLVVGHLRSCSCLPNLSHMKQWCRWSLGPAWSQVDSAWHGNWQCTLQVAHTSTIHRTRTPRASPPPLAGLSSRNVSLPISNSQPFIISHPAGLHRSPSHPSHSHLPGLNSPNPFSLSLYRCSVSPTIPRLSFGPVSSCKTSFFWVQRPELPMLFNSWEPYRSFCVVLNTFLNKFAFLFAPGHSFKVLSGKSM